jgi:hypothetical protein
MGKVRPPAFLAGVLLDGYLFITSPYWYEYCTRRGTTICDALCSDARSGIPFHWEELYRIRLADDQTSRQTPAIRTPLCSLNTSMKDDMFDL